MIVFYATVFKENLCLSQKLVRDHRKAQTTQDKNNYCHGLRFVLVAVFYIILDLDANYLC